MSETLAGQARELIRVLHCALVDLDRCNDYSRSQAQDLRPLVEQLESAVRVERDRERAARLMVSVDKIMQAAGSASSKGEMDIFTGDTYDRYVDLHTIFRETRFTDHAL